MKKLLLILFIAVAFAGCDNPDELDPNENYILITNLEPPNWSVINKFTEIKATMKYNIEPGELEGLGFYFIRWKAYSPTPKTAQWYGDRLIWSITNRTSERDIVIERIAYPPQDGIPDTIHYKYSISRKKSETTGTTIIESNIVSYIVSQ